VEKEQTESLKLMQKTMEDFLAAMQLRDEFAVRVGRRTSQIIRVGSFTVSLLSIAIVYLTATLGSDMAVMRTKMEAMSQTMSGMEKHFNQVVVNTGSMQDGVHRMSINLENMPHMTRLLAEMRDAVTYLPQMTQHVGGIQNEVTHMKRDLNAMHQDMVVMNQSVGAISGAVNHMGYDVNRISAPMKMFPFNP